MRILPLCAEYFKRQVWHGFRNDMNKLPIEKDVVVKRIDGIQGEIEELRGLAAGAEISFRDVAIANVVPIASNGFLAAAAGSATIIRRAASLGHGRRGAEGPPASRFP